MKQIILSVFVIMLISHIPCRAEKMQVAVLDLEPKAVSKILAGAVTDVIRSEMVKTGLYTIIERDRMDAILKEQELQMTGCTDQACAVQIGKLLSARKILLGEINKIGKTLIITVRIVDVEKGTSEFAANEKADSEDMLAVAAKNITRSLSENIVEGNKDFFVVRKTPAGYYMRSIVPGWGQFYAERPVKGAVFLSAFTGSLGFFGYSLYNYSDKKKAYGDQKPPQSAIDAKFSDYEKAADLTLYAGITLAAVYLIHWADALFFSKPDFSTESKNTGLEINDDSHLSFMAGPFPGDAREKHYTVSYVMKF